MSTDNGDITEGAAPEPRSPSEDEKRTLQELYDSCSRDDPGTDIYHCVFCGEIVDLDELMQDRNSPHAGGLCQGNGWTFHSEDQPIQ